MSKKHPALWYLCQVTRGSRGAMAALIALEMLRSLANIGFVMAMRDALDHAVKQQADGLRSGLLCMLGLVALRLLLRAALRHLNEKVRATIENQVKARLLQHLLRCDYAQMEAVHTGEWMNRSTSDSALVANGAADILPSLLGMLVQLVSAVCMIVVMIPQVSWFLLPAVLLGILIACLLRRQSKQYHKAVQECDGRVRVFLQERLQGMMIVRAFSAEREVEAAAQRSMKAHLQARMEKNRIHTIFNICFAGLMNGLFLLCFAYCGYGILNGAITVGTLLAIIQLVGQLQTPFAGLSGIVPRFYAVTASAERLMEPEDYQREAVQPPVEPVDFARIMLDGVDFAYPNEGQKTVLSKASLCVNSGDTVALTGHSGCGKSTIFKLLLCLYRPTGGRLYLETANGSAVPLSPACRRMFAYVPQGNLLMQGTIREIVSCADNGADHTERVQQALEATCAASFVRELPRGMDTLLGERGHSLSEGQMQRLAVARAVYSDAPVLLLDEATSALDANTEAQVLQNLKQLPGKTLLLVAHRPSAIRSCDRVLEVSRHSIREIAY